MTSQTCVGFNKSAQIPQITEFVLWGQLSVCFGVRSSMLNVMWVTSLVKTHVALYGTATSEFHIWNYFILAPLYTGLTSQCAILNNRWRTEYQFLRFFKNYFFNRLAGVLTTRPRRLLFVPSEYIHKQVDFPVTAYNGRHNAFDMNLRPLRCINKTKHKSTRKTRDLVSQMDWWYIALVCKRDGRFTQHTRKTNRNH